MVLYNNIIESRGVGRILNRGLLYRSRACARRNFDKPRPQMARNGAFCACAYRAVPNIRCSNIVIAISSIVNKSSSSFSKLFTLTTVHGGGGGGGFQATWKPPCLRAWRGYYY